MEPDRFLWRSHAACREKPTKWFVPDRINAPEVLNAKKICASCEVRSPCLEFALEVRVDSPTGWSEGIWAGTTEKDRQLIRALMAGRTYQEFKNGARSA